MSTPVLLDTHVLLWWVERRELSQQTVALIETARNESDLWLGAITAFEIGLLSSKRAYDFGTDVMAWWRLLTRGTGVQVWPVTGEIALLSQTLAGELHGDPADRMIIATAITHGARLLTRDRALQRYGEIHGIPIIEA